MGGLAFSCYCYAVSPHREVKWGAWCLAVIVMQSHFIEKYKGGLVFSCYCYAVSPHREVQRGAWCLAVLLCTHLTEKHNGGLGV